LSGRWLSRRCRWIQRSLSCCPIEGFGGCGPLTRMAGPRGIERPWDWRHGTRRPGQAAAPSAAPSAPVGGYRGRKLYCRQIRSFTRAQELLRQGHNYLDRDGDGVACESLR
jgi:hypothetical protein